jgi:hypothetical protein
VSIGEEAVARSNDALFYQYFTDDYVLHGPAGQFNREEIRAYFAALREAGLSCLAFKVVEDVLHRLVVADSPL